MSLRTRLIVSYILLLIVTLTVITVALLIILSSRPGSPQATYQGLIGVAQGLVPRGDQLENVLLDLRRGDFSYLEDFASETGVRVLLVNITDNRLVFDSSATVSQGEPLPLVIDDLALPIQRQGTVLEQRGGAIFGGFTDAAGEWLFAGITFERPVINQTTALLLSEQRQTLTFRQVVREFFSFLAVPMLQAACVGVLIALALAALISRSIARPLQTVARAAAQVSGGNLDLTVPVSGPPEVRDVAESFNKMSAEVLAAQRAQRDFLANVSHDLKTPLTSIQGFSQAIMDGAAKDPAHAASIIHDEAGRLNRMVVQLTDLARIQAGRLSMKSAAVDLGQITEAVAGRLAVVAEQKGVAYHVDSPSLPVIAGDGDRLVQVLNNLISNAIKYTPSGGSVNVKTRTVERGVEVVVQDTGVGIPPKDLPRVFERFYQVDKTRGPERGTGLGLAITYEIVQAHGGKLSVISPGINQGTTFTVWLPLPQLTTIARRRSS